MYLPSIQPSSTLGICLCMNLRSNWWGKCSNTDWLYHLQNKLQAKSDMIRQPHKLCQQGCRSSCLGTLWCTAEMHHSCSKCWLGKWWRTGKRWSQRRWETGNLDIYLLTWQALLIAGGDRAQISKVIGRACVDAPLGNSVVVGLSGGRRTYWYACLIIIKAIVGARADELASVGRQIGVILVGGEPRALRIAGIIGY